MGIRDRGNTYEFAVQANVVCGDGGILRFAVVPKNVQTGGNFGLTNLIVTIHARIGINATTRVEMFRSRAGKLAGA